MPAKILGIYSILLAILLAGAWIRFYDLDLKPLWYDEIGTYVMESEGSVWDVFKELKSYGSNPPLYFLVVNQVKKYIGRSFFIARSVSAVFGILSIWMIFLLSKKMYSYEEGIISAFLMAFMSVPVYYSQEMRSYSMLIFFSILSVYYLFDLIFYDNNELQIYIKYAISVFILAYTHYSGLVFALCQGLFLGSVFIIKKRSIKYIAITFGSLILTYMAWLINKNIFDGFNRKLSLNIPLISYFQYLFNDNLALTCFIVLMFFMLFIKHWLSIKNQTVNKDTLFKDLFIVSWLLIITGALQIALTKYTLIKNFRYLFVSLPAVYILSARAFTSVVPGLIVRVVLIILFFSYSANSIYGRLYNSAKVYPWDESAGYINKNYSFSDKSIIISNILNIISIKRWGVERSKIFFGRYLEAIGINAAKFTWIEDKLDRKWSTEKQWKKLDNKEVVDVLKKNKIEYVWIWSVMIQDEQENNLLSKNLIMNNFQLIKSIKFGDAQVDLLKQRT